MPITLGKKSIEVEKVFGSIPMGIAYKSLKVSIEATETPKEIVVNLYVTIQCEKVSIWRRIIENLKRIFSRSNS